MSGTRRPPVPVRYAREAIFTLGKIEPLYGIPHRTLSHASDRGEELAGYGPRRAKLVTIGALIAAEYLTAPESGGLDASGTRGQ